jgi:hypothetical protein
MKEQLIELSEEKGFKSKLSNLLHVFNAEIAEETTLIRYLWLCELQKWLRGEYNIHVWVEPFKDVDEIVFILRVLGYKAKGSQIFHGYTVALEHGLYEALKLIK